MKTIKLTRPNEKFNRNTSYIVFDSNGKKIDMLPNGASIEFNISDDVTFIQVKIAWCGSGKIQIPNSSKSTDFIVSGNRFLNTYLIYSGALFVLIGLLFNKDGLMETIGITIRVLLIAFVVFSVTLLKNKWLNYQVIHP